MATAKFRDEMLQRLHLVETEHPVWSHAFGEPLRCAQIEEDLFAARSVCGVLIAIVTGGALLGALAVSLATLL